MPSAAAATPDEMIVMGQVVLPWGVRGWVKVRPFTETPDALLGFATWWLRASEARPWTATQLIGGREHADALVAQLAGIDSREDALALRGFEIGVPRSALPGLTQGEIYRSDLVGLAVVNREGVDLGVVRAVEDFGAHPLLRVGAAAGSGMQERLIPYVPTIVDAVDLAVRTIRVDWGEDY